jgi:PAS domain S-box-containing protein
MDRKFHGIRRHIVPLIIVVLGILLSTAAFYAARYWEKQKIRDAFETQATERNSALEREIQINLLVLSSLQAYCSHGTVEREAFRNFVGPLLQQHRSIEALEYIPRVPDRERASWEARARRDGLPGFRVTERGSGKLQAASRRKEYFPVYYLEPRSGREIALGFDLASDRSRKEAMERSRESGQLVATPPLTLVHAKTGASGVLVFAPIYRRIAANASVEMRRRDLTGFALGVLYHGDILEKTFGYFQPGGIDVYIYDTSVPGQGPIYFHRTRKISSPASSSGATHTEQDVELQSAKRVDVAGRQWLVVYRGTPYFTAGADHTLAPTLLALGLLLTGVLARYLMVVIRRAEVVGKLVEKRTLELRQEIAVRAHAELELQKAHAQLESRVEERTAALMESERRYRQLFHRNPQPMWVYDLETLAFLDVNEAAVRGYGYSREEFLAMTIKEIRPPEDVPDLIADVLRAKQGFRNSGIWRHLRKDGGVISVEITMHRFDFGGKDAELVLSHDVTARVRADQEKEALEAQLRQAQKMEAIGTLAGGIAHDFNNILTAIVGYATLLKMKLGEDSHYVERILAASERAATLTRSLLAYSRKQVSKPRPIDLSKTVHGVAALLRGLIPESIELEVALAEGELTVMADPGQIDQVLMNLATNARDAMPEGGRLRIASERMELGPEFAKAHGYGKPGSYAALTVSDTGCGMERATCERIFEPFFTTKEVGKGTGLGLSMAYGIVKQHSGYINVDSVPGNGTTFTIYLPITDQAAVPIQPVAPFLTIKGRETILLIEDDPEIRTPLKELLELEGYSVREAVDGEDGVRRFRQWQDAIQLVILDVVMPKKNGRAVYEEILKLRPGAKALFISGYTDEILTGKAALPADFTLISKPIRIHKLLEAMREVLARP